MMSFVLAGGKPTLNYRDHAYTITPSGSSSHTASGLSFGPAVGARYIVAAIGFTASSNLSSVTIGGVAATILVTAAANTRTAIAIAKVPTGTSGSVVITGTSLIASGISVYSLSYIRSASATDTASDSSGPTISLTTDADARGVIVATVASLITGTGSWSNATVDFNTNTGSTFVHTSASYVATAAVTQAISCTTSGGAATTTGVSAAFR